MRYEGRPYGADGFFGLAIEFPNVNPVLEELAQFGSNYAAKYLGSALRKSIKPAVNALKKETPVGPTGNLKRAVTSKIVPYYGDGNAVAMIGYRATGKGKTAPTGGKVQKGKDRAFHQGFLEFGTKTRTVKAGVKGYVRDNFRRKQHQRRTPSGTYVNVRGHSVTMHGVNASQGSIASSYGTLGKFTIAGGNRGRVQTTPAYPNAFFKRSKKGEPMRVGRMIATEPIATAYRASVATVQTALEKNLIASVQSARNELAGRTAGRL